MKSPTKLNKVIMYCDGASRGNPGKAAIAYIIKDEVGNVLKKFMERIGIATNNTTEYRAIITGLKACSKLTDSNVVVYSDSNLAINQINDRWRINKDHLRRLYREVKELEKRFKKVMYIHKPRTDINLQEADRLANEALD